MRSLTPPYNVAECDPMESMDDNNMNSLYNTSPHPASLPSCVEEENNYQDLKPMRSVYDDDMDETHSWKKRHPDEWGHSEVMSWLTHLAFGLPESMDIAQLHLEKFQQCSGRQMSEMSAEDFTRLEPQYGSLIYERFQELLKESQYNAPADMDITYTTYNTHTCTELSHLDLLNCDDFDGLATDDLLFGGPDMSDMGLESEDIGMLLRRTSSSEHESGYGTDGSTGDVCSESLSSTTGLASSMNRSLPMMSSSPQGAPLPSMRSFLSNSSLTNNNNDNFRDLNIPSVVTNHIYSAADSTTAEMPKSPLNKVNKRGRPRKNPEDPNGNRVKSHRGRKQATKGSHLWEFVRDLLLDQECNPSIIRWENREDGVFRFVKSEQVAKMWGQRKNNSTMTYEKLSRAMRHYYKNRILLPVLGRRLVYQFGPGSNGWRSIDHNPHYNMNSEPEHAPRQRTDSMAAMEGFRQYPQSHRMQQLYHRQYDQLQNSSQTEQENYQSNYYYNHQYHQSVDNAPYPNDNYAMEPDCEPLSTKEFLSCLL